MYIGLIMCITAIMIIISPITNPSIVLVIFLFSIRLLVSDRPSEAISFSSSPDTGSLILSPLMSSAIETSRHSERASRLSMSGNPLPVSQRETALSETCIASASWTCVNCFSLRSSAMNCPVFSIFINIHLLQKHYRHTNTKSSYVS